jgi:dephospho-CoA kinase
MYIVGMTGGIGSGKSEAARLFAELGVPIVDVDVISHELTASEQPTLEEITNTFGQAILNDDGSLNRAALRQKVFANSEARKQLEAIIHPAIFDKAMEALNKNATAPYQVLAIPLLFESDRYLKIINRSLVIDSTPEMQIARASKRDGLLKADIQKIIDVQMSRTKRNSLADDIILNESSIEELRGKIKQAHEKYINTCVIDNSNS